MWKKKKKQAEEHTSTDDTFMDGILTEEDFLDADEIEDVQAAVPDAESAEMTGISVEDCDGTMEDIERGMGEVVEDSGDGELEEAVEEPEEEEQESGEDSEDGEPEEAVEESEEEEQESGEDSEDGELEEVIEGSEEEKPYKHSWKIILAVAAGVLAVVYGGVALYFTRHFLPYTVLNGVDVSMCTVAQVEEIQEQKVNEYILKMNESDGDIAILNGKDIDLTYERDGKVKKTMKTQNPLLWITGFWEASVLNETVSTSYDTAKLNKVINGLECMDEANQVPAVSAHPEYNGEKFEIVEGEVGTQIQRERFTEAIQEAIEALRTELYLAEEDCYIEAEYDADDPKVEQACQEMNDYLGAEVTLDFSPYTEVVDGTLISTWISCSQDMEITFSQEQVNAYVENLAETYDTYGKTRQFVTGYGNTVEVSGGSFGWKIDQAAEIQALLTNIENKDVVTREPVYASRGVSHEAKDMGNTYAEVDLTRQHMFYFQDGQLMMESDVVTGNPNSGNATPQGVYSLAYKQTDTNLRGPKKEDGTYEWDSPVKYWMPFNGGIGFHDATWQSAFGGDRYLTAGSHGCVNLPYEAAGQLYSLIQAGVPVVCHY